MNHKTSSHIYQLLESSGLLPNQNKKPEYFNGYDFSKESILITGAAGTIGSGLTQHLLHGSFKQLILIDNAETPLYYLLKNLELERYRNVHISIVDIREKEIMEWLFKTYRPTLIFHAAAYKHVSLLETNPYEAVKINILATKVLADLAIEYKTQTFVFISSDKAVNPISVMGMTKLIAEKYIDSLNNNKHTAFITTRFGNIFGSNGSIVPLFINQIKADKPLTITHLQATRYFIDLNKACTLILKVATMPEATGSLVTFNMGDPIKIKDLADIFKEVFNYKNDIKTIDLKDGERLHETLISENEILVPTSDEDIFIVEKKEKDLNKVNDLSSLHNITRSDPAAQIKNILITYM